jgi:nucleoid-associated protein YgaU
MERYQNIQKINIKGKGLIYDSVLMSYFEPLDSDIVIITSAEDRLDLLANHYFGDASLWWVIAAKNNLLDIDLKLEPGTTLRIPNNITSVLDKIK